MTTIQMTENRTDAIRGMLRLMVQNEPELRRKRIQKRVLSWGAAGVFAAGALGTAGAVVLTPAPVTESTVVHCLASPTRGSNGDFVEQQATLSTPNGNRMTAKQSVELCRTVWVNGAFQKSAAIGQPTVEAGSAPSDLTMCVMGDGSAAVLPGRDEVCAQAGLAPVTQD